MKRVYISGPMTGLPAFNFPAFNAAAETWRNYGWAVENPAESFGGNATMPYTAYVAHDLRALARCHAIAMLPGWDGPNSRGAVWEREVAKTLFGLVVLDANEPRSPNEAMPGLTIVKPAESILQEAQYLVHGPRGEDYNHPIVDYTRTGRMWGAILNTPDIDPRIACLMMAAVKISREVNKHKRDNLTDLAGYAECAQMVAERQEEG